MHIADLLSRDRPSFSFEFFPPRTAAASDALFETILDLRELGPDFVDVTYGAGGGTRDLTAELVTRIRREAGLETIPHLTCVCHSREDLEAILAGWAEDGVSNVLALGGDLPRDKPDWDRGRRRVPARVGPGRGSSSEIGESGHTDARGFGVGVAGFPRGPPRHAQPARRDGPHEGEGGRRGGLRLHADVLRQPRLLRLPRAAATSAGVHHPDRRGDHADHLREGDASDGGAGRGQPLPPRRC